MKKYILHIIVAGALLVSVSGISFAQSSVTGVVKSGPLGSPLSGVTVTIIETSTSTITDGSGQYTLGVATGQIRTILVGTTSRTFQVQSGVNQMNMWLNAVTDYDGNSYSAVEIGTQVWLGENLKVTHFNNGDVIPIIQNSSVWGNSSSPAYCWYNNNSANINPYGALYSWYTVETGNLCPTGWHTPSYNEWETLRAYLGGIYNAGGPLKEAGATHWTTPNAGATNVTGFTALAGGDRTYTGSFMNINADGHWWTSSEFDSNDGWSAYMLSSESWLGNFHGPYKYGFSVRCLQGTVEKPSVSTQAASNITTNSVEIDGNVSNDGGNPILERGICWNTSSNPTYFNSRIIVSGDLGTLTCLITGLTPNTTYYARAFARNIGGISYGNEITFATFPEPPVAVISSATDVTSTTSTLHGTVNANGVVTLVTFQCGLTPLSLESSSFPAIPGSVTGTASTPVTASLINLTPGSTYYYRIKAESSGGTTYSNILTFHTCPSISISSAITNVSCFGGNNGSVNISIIGGVSPYTYTWTGPNGYSSVLEDPGSLLAGTYTVIVRDANLCEQSASVLITEPDALEITLTPINATCNGGNMAISAAIIGTPFADLQINIDGGGFAPVTASPVVFNSLTATNHTIILRRISDNTCQISRSVAVTQPDVLDLNLMPINATCFGGNGSISAGITGTPLSDLEINIDGGSFALIVASPVVFNGLAVGNHTIILRRISDNSCQTSRSVSLTQPDALDLILTPTNATCYGGVGSISAAISGTPLDELEIGIDDGEMIQVTTNPVVFNNLSAGSHSILLQRTGGGSGCYVVKSASVTQPMPIVAPAVLTNVSCNSCNDGAIDITASGGTGTLTFSWTGPNGFNAISEDLVHLRPGVFNLTVTDINSCFVSNTYETLNPFVVINIDDTGDGTLRNAINVANVTATVNPDTITFNIPGTGPFPIVLQTALPWINDPVIINGYSQPGSVPATSSDTAKIMIRIYGTNAGPDAYGLYVNAENCTINGLYISNFKRGIYLNEYGKNIIKGNLIRSNRSCGIFVYSSDNEIGGITPDSRNIIIKNGVGIQLDNSASGGSPGWGRNKILGNYIGIDPTGNNASGNTTGIVNVDSPDNIIGGTVREARNVISSNGTGIRFEYFRYDAVRNKILGNYIGTNAGGSEALGNTYSGITMNSPDNFIGDVQDGSGNLISGNGNGIHLGIRAIGNMIKANFIGTDYSGYKAIPNTIGGIEIRGGKNNQIGGLLPGEGNLISGNTNEGILIFGEFYVDPNPANGNIVQGNFIGTDRSGLKQLGNGTGIRIGEDANNNVIGGMENGAGNLIAFNNNCGVVIADPDDPGTGNKILSNSIHSNGGLGIDLGDNGVTLSNTDTDPLDSDTGPNNLQNYPAIDSLNYTSGTVYIKGHLNSAANTQYTLEFFANKVADNTGYGEGRSYLGSKTVTTDGSGTVSFSGTFSRSTGWGDVITATATDAAGNTSEFSEAVGGLSDQIIAAANWPFHFSVNDEGIPRITNGSDITAVGQSFNTWENVSTAKIDFENDGTTPRKSASATDHMNLVSFVDNEYPFPPRVLAIAAKTLQVSPNDDVARIIDADIVVNPVFSAHDVGVGNGDFYDAQSIITHEIGHVMGLLHTGIVNSTMFYMLGYGTKVTSLEQDDRSWASYKYPGSTYNATFGSISGHISYGYGGDNVAGALVMAIRTGVANPDTIHAFSDASGNYLVPGLPPGNYNIYIQPLDGSVNGFNLRPGNISVYIYCNTIYTDYPGEFLSNLELGDETSEVPPNGPVSVTVTAGSDTPAGEIITNIDNIHPILQKVRPTDPEGVQIKVLSNFTLTFTEPIDMSTLTSQTCYLELGAPDNKQIGGTFYSLPDSTNIVIFNPESVLDFSKTYALHLTDGIKDHRGNDLIVPAIKYFTTVDSDKTPPTVKGTYPKNGTVNVLVAEKIKVFFSEAMNTESLNDGFALTFAGGIPAVTTKVDGSITWDAEKTTLTFTPLQSLIEGTNYIITVSTGATDLSGNHLATVNNFTFGTVEVAVPEVKYLGPTNSQTGVTIETPIVADFSEAIDPQSVSSSTFYLRPAGSTSSITGEFEFLNGNARVVFRPASNLTPGAVYTATLTTDIKDVSPTVSTLAANVTSTFTTAPTPAAPAISFLDPPRGKVGAAVTISGSGFDPTPSKNLISFNGITAIARTATLNTLTTVVPIGTQSGSVTVTVNGRTSNPMQFDIIPDYLNDPDYTTSNKSLPSGTTGGSAVSGSGEAVFAMVTNPENNSITRIGLGTSGTSVPIVTGGLYPVKVDIDQLGKYAYVTNYYSHDVSVIDLGTNKVSKIIPAGVGPFGVAVTSDGKRVYVSNYESGNLSLIDVDPTSGGFDHVVANVPTGTNPGNIAVTGDAGMVLVTGPFGLKIVNSDPKSDSYNSVVATVSSGTQTKDVTVTADAGFAIVATTEGSLLIINLHPENDDYSGAVVASVPTGTTVSDVKASGDAVYVYATDTENDRILVYKFSSGGTGSSGGSSAQGITLIPLDPIPVPDGPSGLNVSPAGDKIYTITSNLTSRQVTTISLAGFKISPENTIESLISTVQTLIDNKLIKLANGNELISFLNSALTYLAANKTKDAINRLNTFVVKVQDYVKSKQIDKGIGQSMINAATAVINYLKGIKSGEEDFYPADIDQQSNNEVIIETRLGIIYPNPTKDAITINYEIAENEKGSEKVTIQIFDVIGRLVSNLVNENMAPGRYTATWKGNFESGETASRGFYFIRFSAGNVRDVKQIMLIR